MARHPSGAIVSVIYQVNVDQFGRTIEWENAYHVNFCTWSGAEVPDLRDVSAIRSTGSTADVWRNHKRTVSECKLSKVSWVG